MSDPLNSDAIVKRIDDLIRERDDLRRQLDAWKLDHDENCVHTGADLDRYIEMNRTLERHLDAARSVIRHWHDEALPRGPHRSMAEWNTDDWADSGWTPTEADVIRAALAGNEADR